MSESLEERVETMKQEIDALQIAAAKESSPWYKNVSTLLSVIALVFSFGTTFVSYHRASLQGIHDARQELRGMLQRLAALPKENVEIGVKYANDQRARSLVSSFINQEGALLARNSAEVAKKLPPQAITASELYAVAYALQAAYDLAGASEFLQAALSSNPDFNTEIACLRMMADMRFRQNRIDEGRVIYQQALAIFSKYPQFDDFTKANTHVITELNWAFAEAGTKSFPFALQHVANSEKILAGWPDSPGVIALRSEVAQGKKQIEMGQTSPSNPLGLLISATPAPSYH